MVKIQDRDGLLFPFLRMVTVIIPGPMKPGSAIVLSPMMDKDTVQIPGFFP